MTDEIYDDIDGERSPLQRSELIGQERAVSHFVKSCQTGRLPQTWLLQGAKGVGKMTFACQAARAVLNVTSPIEIKSLTTNDSHVDKLITQRAHPDLFIAQRRYDEKQKKFKAEISIDDIRALKEFASLSASMKGWRVAIVDSLDEANIASSNALLKIAEEPPARLVLFLIAHNSGRVLDTIRSRCQKISFPALTDEEVKAILANDLPTLDEQELAAIAYLAGGSVGRAFMLAESGGLNLYHDMVTLLSQLPRVDTQELHALAGRVKTHQANIQGLETFSFLFGQWLYRLVKSQAHQNTPQPLFTEDEDAIKLFSQAAKLEHIILLWERVVKETRNQVIYNLDAKQIILDWYGASARIIRGQKP